MKLPVTIVSITLMLFPLTLLAADAQSKPVSTFLNALNSNQGNDWLKDNQDKENPIIEGQQALLLFEKPVDQWRLIGDFNSWGRWSQQPGLDGGHLLPIGETGWSYRIIELPKDSRTEYMLADTERNLYRDMRNPKHTLSFDRDVSEIHMPEYVDPLASLPLTSNKGQLTAHSFPSPPYEEERRVWMYTPANMDKNGSYATVYFNDGGFYIDAMGIPELMDRLIASGQLEPMVAIFVDTVVRREDYRRNEDFRRFMTDTLVPWVDQNYPTIKSAEQRGIVGSSRGGLAAIDLAFAHPEVFGLCGAFTPALTPMDMETSIAQADHKPVRFHIQGSSLDLRFKGDYYNLKDLLNLKGYQVSYNVINEGHNQPAWRGYFPTMITALYPKD